MSEVVRPIPGAYAYAPELRVKVFGTPLADDVLRDVTETRVTLQESEPAGFSIVLANSDPGKRGLSSSKQITPFKYTDDKLLDAKTPISIDLGYAGRLRTMIVGEILTFTPTFPQAGLSTLTITGNDFFNRLRNARPGSDDERIYKGKADWEIAKIIAQRHGLDVEVDEDGPVNDVVQQGDDDDLKFLLKRAQYVGFTCFITLEGNPAKPKLYFTKPRDLRDDRQIDVFEYRWGESLLSFSPKLSIVGAVKRVTVRGWDARKKEAIEYVAELKDLPKTGGNGRAAAEVLADDDFSKEIRIVRHAVQSKDEAKRLAINILEENAHEFITGSGEVMGDPDLRPGVVLRLQGLGKRFSGDYRLVKTEHVFSSSGYVTSFEVKRMREEAKPS